MPLYLNIPLPGPFSYGKRIGNGRRKSGSNGILWWLVIGWWWMPCWWLLLAMWWCCKVTWRALDRRNP